MQFLNPKHVYRVQAKKITILRFSGKGRHPTL